MSIPDPYSEHRENYEAETAVDLRKQRLRRQSDPNPEPAVVDEDTDGEHDAGTDAFDDGDVNEVFADPYQVGQDALAANEEPAIDIPAEYGGRDFDSETAELDNRPALWGLRGRVNAALGLTRPPLPESAEARFRQSVRRVQQPLPGCMVVSVIGLKGDAGKTSTTTALANTFGTHRGRGVVAWDACENSGTLGHRAHRTTDPELGPWDILENARALASADAVSGTLGHYLRLQPTHDEVLASDSSTSRQSGIGWDECAALMAVLRRHRDLIIVDTGNNATASNWQWAVQHSDILVIPLPLRRDMAILTMNMLDGIIARGYEHLVRSALILTVVLPGDKDSVDTALRLEGWLEKEFEAIGGVGRIMRVPYEPKFASGERIRYQELGQATVEAYTNVAAEIADRLADRAYERTAEYADAYAPQEFTRPSQAERRPPRRPYSLPPHSIPQPAPQSYDADADYDRHPPREQWRPRAVPPRDQPPREDPFR
ncbi:MULTISPECIES: ParA family protein [unclassified Rhodococcus (in: high G+C Gram-positive bacteria)]|uniref:MinD/ParA family ATP-binding protein n=1 Tax=unclassified Rhodococcus (in: high G+C Gram-positive bacteria) TaxID=192944 RepID=UPI0011405DFB|nr:MULTISPECIES: ParA family protein [unclassified Rhodococcus (in: high G+C Gram-positive bacteria)]